MRPLNLADLSPRPLREHLARLSTAARRAHFHAAMTEDQAREYLKNYPHDAMRLARAMKKRIEKRIKKCPTSSSPATPTPSSAAPSSVPP